MSHADSHDRVKKKPFPSGQLFVLALCRICEPIAFMSIFPYCYVMVKSFHITDDEDKITMYAGMVIAAFTLAEFLASIVWGRISDKIGRRPVLLTGLAGTGISMLIFGFARSLPLALFARGLGGILNGNIGVLQTTVAEVVEDEEDQPKALSFIPFIWSLGAIVGSVLGGALAQPVENYPQYFADDGIFAKYPFLLPNLVCTVIITCGVIIGLLFLQESHGKILGRRDPGLELGKWILHRLGLGEKSTATAVSDGQLIQDNDDIKTMGLLASTAPAPQYGTISASSTASSAIEPRPTDAATQPEATSEPEITWKQLLSKQIILNIIGYGILAFHTISADQLLPILFALPESDSPPRLPFKFEGGLALSTKTIGTFLSIQAAFLMLMQLNAFPHFQKKLGPLWTFRISVFSYPFLYFIIPYITLVPPAARYVIIFPILFWKVFLQSLAYPSVSMMFIREAPSKSVLGTVNGIGQSGACLARTVGPVISGMVQTQGLKSGYAGLSWWFCALAACAGLVSTAFQQDRQWGSLLDVELGRQQPAASEPEPTPRRPGKTNRRHLYSILRQQTLDSET